MAKQEGKGRGYGWAASAGANAAMAAVMAKAVSAQWFAGAFLIVLGTVVLSKSSTEPEHESHH